MTPAAGILETFISHFQRAIRQEMDAMRERKGSFEVFLTSGERIESGEIDRKNKQPQPSMAVRQPAQP